MPRKRSQHCLSIAAVIATGLMMAAACRGWVPSTPAEVFGTVIGLASMVLAVRENIWNFPTGMAYNICYMVIFFHARLYGMMGLQVVYFALQGHGWYCWKYGIHRTPARISHVPTREALVLLLIGVPATAALAWYLRHVGGVVALGDAWTTVFSLLAQYMLNLKRIENWALGVALDVVFIIIYVSQGLYFTAGSFVVYLTVCILGYRQWSRDLQVQMTAPLSSEDSLADTVSSG